MTFDSHANLLKVTVTVAPSTPTAGTSVSVSNADAATLRTNLPAPFNLTACPSNGAIDPTTSEIIRVTAIGANDSGGTGNAQLTITRQAETGGVNRSIAIGDILKCTITKKSLTDLENILTTGWIGETNTWSYVSTDGHIFVFNVNADVTGIYQNGFKVKCTNNGTTFYGFITNIGAFSGGNTPITVYGGTDYTLVTGAITNPYFSLSKAPFGFPLNPDKWTEKATDTLQRSQATPTASTWYNLGSLKLDIPIGVWRVIYTAFPQMDRSGGGDLFMTLSTGSTTQSDGDFTAELTAAPTGTFIGVTMNKEKILSLTTKTSYFLNTQTDNTSATTIYNRGDIETTVVKAVCAYL